MVDAPLFARLDAARLDATLTRRAVAALPRAMELLIGGHSEFHGGLEPVILRRGAQELVDQLCDEFVLARKRVVLRDEPRPHRRRRGRIEWELHGQCRMHGSIEIFVRTAARERPIALKSLLETLLHEFVHHHDFDAFGASIHCGGFYERLGQLYRPLKVVVERAGSGPAGGKRAVS